jgi:hypothetical protein
MAAQPCTTVVRVAPSGTRASAQSECFGSDDRRARHRHAALCLATTVLIVVGSSTGATDGAPPDAYPLGSLEAISCWT